MMPSSSSHGVVMWLQELPRSMYSRRNAEASSGACVMNGSDSSGQVSALCVFAAPLPSPSVPLHVRRALVPSWSAHCS